jgi:N-methylhydantoinase A
MPFGGAGPLHGVALAESVSAKNVIVPVAPGITAAMGLLQTDMQYEHARSLIASLSRVTSETAERMNHVLKELMSECRQDLEQDGVPAARHNFQRIAECRYHGQGFELRADIPEGEITRDNVSNIVANFHAQHQLDYGYAFEDGEVELITIRAIGMEPVTPLKVARLEQAAGGTIDDAFLYRQQTVFDDGQTLETPRYDREKLKFGHVVPGPALVIQHNSTILIPPSYVAQIGEFGNLTIERSN